MGPGPILLLLLFLGPTFLAFLTLIFIGSFFSANSLVSCSKSCTVGQCYYFWRSSSSQHYFFSHLLVLLLFLSLLLRLRPLPKNFPSTGLANSPKIGAPIDASSPIDSPAPFCFTFPPIYQTPFFTYCFPLVILRNRHHFD